MIPDELSDGVTVDLKNFCDLRLGDTLTQQFSNHILLVGQLGMAGLSAFGPP